MRPQTLRAMSADPRHFLLQDASVSAFRYVCRARPGDAGEDEVFSQHTLALVQRGSFACLCENGRHELLPGSLFIGRPGRGYRCLHDHGHGADECLAFRFEPGLAEELGPLWQACVLPPLPQLAALPALVERGVALDELGLYLAQRAQALLAPPRSRDGSEHLRARLLRAAQWIEAQSGCGSLRLADAARQASLSPHHFLRAFVRAFGLTPHQYLLRCRVAHAACLLASDAASVTELALQAGFNDLSNFSRCFRRSVGLSPRAFRRLTHSQQRRMAQDLPRLPACD
jgi:AraC family transcriptional regulator